MAGLRFISGHSATTSRAFIRRWHNAASRSRGRRPGARPSSCSATRDALLEFQKRQRLQATGTLDEKTAAALAAPVPPGAATLRAAGPLPTATQAGPAASSRVAGATSASTAGAVLVGGALTPCSLQPRHRRRGRPRCSASAPTSI